jgi:hypothetical protein
MSHEHACAQGGTTLEDVGAGRRSRSRPVDVLPAGTDDAGPITIARTAIEAARA